MKYKVILLTAFTFFTTCFVSNSKNNILSLKESITDNAIVYPSSFETNTKEMMENWYLKNYAIIDESNIENRNYGEVSDAEYIKRLKKLPTTIEMPFNQIVRSYIERYVKRSRTLVAQMLGMSPYYMPIFEEALERHQMPLELKYIPIIESALNPNAVSPAGAGGLWQFMVTTAKGVGLQVNSLVDERRDPYRSSDKAVLYFKQLYNTYGDWSLAIAAYNCGPGNVNKAIRRAGTDHPDFWEIYNYLPRETRGYVPAFIAANYVMTYYAEHNISPTLTKKPLIIDTVQVNERINFNQISQVLNIPLEEIRILNPQYRHDVIPGDIRPYTLALPSQQIYSYIMAEDKIITYHRKQFEQRAEVQPGDIKSIIDDESEYMADKGVEYHEVTDGEDFVDIADRYGMQYDDLMEINNLTSTTLHKGQVLKIIRKGNYKPETVMSYNNNNSSKNDDDYAYNQPQNNYNQGSGHYDSDNRPVPTRNNNREEPKKQSVPARQSSSNNYSSNQAQKQNNDDEMKRQREEAAAKKRADEAAKKKRQEEAAAAKKRADEAAKKKRQEEAARQRAEKKKAEEAAKRKAEQERRRREAEKPIKHQVKEGNNLTRLANQYGVSIEDIKKANNLTDDNIQIGKTILIPKKDSKGRVIMPKESNQKTQRKDSTSKAPSKQKSSTKQSTSKQSTSKQSKSKTNNSTVQPKKSSKNKKK